MNWSAFASALSLIFVAELGDKTQLAVISQTCKFRRPWAVFLGAALALTAVTALGAVGGQLLGQVIPETLLQRVAALAFVAMGVLIGREALRAGRGSLAEGLDCPVDGGTDCSSEPAWDWKAFNTTLGLLFVAELGDKTQLAVFSLAGKWAAPQSVFLGGALALTLVTALGVIGGQGLRRLIPERLLLWISAVVFVGMGVLMQFGLL